MLGQVVDSDFAQHPGSEYGFLTKNVNNSVSSLRCLNLISKLHDLQNVGILRCLEHNSLVTLSTVALKETIALFPHLHFNINATQQQLDALYPHPSNVSTWESYLEQYPDFQFILTAELLTA